MLPIRFPQINKCIDLNVEARAAVSYTHLDVYKRQVMSTATGKNGRKWLVSADEHSSGDQ